MEWLGEIIPNNWRTARIKEFLAERKELCDNDCNLDLLSVSEYYGVAKRKNVIKDTDILSRAESVEGYKICHPGDLVMNIMLAWKRATGYCGEDGITSPAYAVYRPTEDVCMKYFHYLFRTDIYAKYFENNSTGIIPSRYRLYPDVFLGLRCHYPPYEIQSRIASFLDSRIAKIDDSIARYKALSDKLDEYRKAIITKAVTEGINDTCFVKCDLGWVNVIPKKWGIALLSQLYYPVKCYNYGMIERNLLSLSYGKIKRKNIENAEGLVPDNYEGYNIIEKDDIVLRLTDLQNDQKSLRVGISKEKGIVTSAYCSIRPIRDFNSTYYYYLLYAFDICKGFYGMGSGIRQGLNWNELKFMKVQIPSKPEQDEIVAYLDKKCSGIDNSKAKIEAVVKKLEEYKKSLIYNAVTGKIEC